MSPDSEKLNITGGNWTKYCTVAKSVDRGRPIWTSVVVRARASLALCGRFNQFRSPYSWITMRRALRKRRVFDFVPSYLKRSWEKTKNDTTFVRMRSSDHLRDAKMSKKVPCFVRFREGQICKTLPQIFKLLPQDLVPSTKTILAAGGCFPRVYLFTVHNDPVYFLALIDRFFSFWKAQTSPSHSKSNISTTTSAATTIDKPLERSAHCASDDEKRNTKPFKCLRYTFMSEGSRVPRTETENPIVLHLWSSYEVRSFASRQLGSLSSFAVYINFLDVSSYHSKAVSKVAATSQARRSIEREIDQLGHFKRLQRYHFLSDFQIQIIHV